MGAPNLRDGKGFSTLQGCAPFSSFLGGGTDIGAAAGGGKGSWYTLAEKVPEALA